MGLRSLYDGHPSPLDTKNIRDNLLSRQAALQRALHAVQHDMDVTPGQNTISFPMLLGSEQNSGISENLSQLPNFDSITLLSYKEASVLAGMPCIKSPDGNESIDLYFSASALDDITDTATGKKGFRSGNPMDVRVYARVHGFSTGGIDNFGMTYVDGGSYTLTTLYQTDGDTWWQLNAAGRHGQSFTVPASSNGKPLKSISLYMKQNGSPNGYVYVAIVGKSGDVPNTIPTEDITLWSNYVDTSSLSTSGGWVEFKFNGPLPKLVTGDVYQIRIFGDPSASVYLDISGAGYSGGNASHYDTGSSSWIADSGSDLYIAITHYGISTIYFWTDPSSYHKWQDVYVSATMIFNHGIYSEEGDADFKIHIPSEGALNAICILDTATRGMLHWRCGHVRTPHISIIQSGAATDGQVLTADGSGGATWQSVDKGCRVYNSSAQSIPNATWTALTFNSEVYDTDGMHSTSTNTNRVTCVTAGKYLVWGYVTFDANATGNRYAAIKKNGTFYVIEMRSNFGSGSTTVLHVDLLINLAEGDYVELFARQESGGSLNVHSGNTATVLAAQRLV